MNRSPFCLSFRTGFTLVETLVAVAIVVVLLLILTSITDSTRKIWTRTEGKIEEFREARTGFESMTRRLSQATLNTYWDYEYPKGDTTQFPSRYVRQSELRFISDLASKLNLSSSCVSHATFFQAPLGFVDDQTNYGNLQNLLNTWGYFVEFGSDPNRPSFLPAALSNHARYRLFEFMEPSESLSLYLNEKKTTGGNAAYKDQQWFLNAMTNANRPAHVIAENVLALILLPKLSPSDEKQLIDAKILNKNLGTNLAPKYAYDSTVASSPGAINSKNQLPPMVQVTMVAVEQTSFDRFQGTSTTPPAQFTSKFADTGDLLNASNPGYAKDLKDLTDALQKEHIKYRVFTTEVSLKAAKWSREQLN